jgi:DNA-binding response OmpR family regulator
MSRSETIVLVEDDEGHVLLFRKQLRRHGILNSILHFATGADTLAWLHTTTSPAEAPRLFVLDLNLPDMPGTRVLAGVAAHRVARTAPVVMLTSSDEQADVRRCLDLGCRHYMVKPLQVGQLVAICADLGRPLSLDPMMALDAASRWQSRRPTDGGPGA